MGLSVSSVVILLFSLFLTIFIKETSQDNLWDSINCLSQEKSRLFCLSDSRSTKLLIHKDRNGFNFALGSTSADFSSSPSNTFIGVGISKDRVLGDDLAVYCIDDDVTAGTIGASGLPAPENSENLNWLNGGFFQGTMAGFVEGMYRCNFNILDIELNLSFSNRNRNDPSNGSTTTSKPPTTFNLNTDLFIHLLGGDNKGPAPITEVPKMVITLGPINLSNFNGEQPTTPKPVEPVEMPDPGVFPIHSHTSSNYIASKGSFIVRFVVATVAIGLIHAN